MKIKKDDNIIIISGKDRGKTGRVEKVLPKEGKLVIAGLNLKKFHQKPRRADQKGQIIEKSMPIDVSNVMITDPKTKKPTRIGIKVNEDGKRQRVAKKSGTVVN